MIALINITKPNGRPGELKVTLAREGISGQLPPTVGFTTWWPRTSHAA